MTVAKQAEDYTARQQGLSAEILLGTRAGKLVTVLGGEGGALVRTKGTRTRRATLRLLVLAGPGLQPVGAGGALICMSVCWPE